MRLFPLAALALLSATSTPTLACPPPPMPPYFEGESQADYRARIEREQQKQHAAYLASYAKQQAEHYETADQVFVARITKRGLHDGWRKWADLKPVKWIKGKGKKRSYRVRLAGSTSCGDYGGGDAVLLAEGELLLVMLRPDESKYARAEWNYAFVSLLNTDIRQRVVDAGFKIPYPTEPTP